MPRHADAIRVLIVEDEAAIRSGLLDLLQSAGLDALAAADAEEALTHIVADPAITVLLTDLYMPGANGMELAAQVRRIRPDQTAVEAVVLTSAATLDPAMEAFRDCIFEFLRKPVRGRPLLSSLRGAHDAAIDRRATDRNRTGMNVRLDAGSPEARRAFLALVDGALRNPRGPIAALAEIVAGHVGRFLPPGMTRDDPTPGSLSGQPPICLVEALTTISALNGGTRKIRIVSFSPAAILRELLERHRHAPVVALPQPAEADAADPPILTDPDVLLIVLEQILTDALRRYPEPGQHIRAGYAIEPGQVVFTIASPAQWIDINRIGELQTGLAANEPSAIGQHLGQGLGLLLATHITELLGGTAVLQSNQEAGMAIALSVPLRAAGMPA